MSSPVFVRRTFRCGSEHDGAVYHFSTLSIFDPTPDGYLRPGCCPICGMTMARPVDEQLALTPEIAIAFLERAAAVARKRISE